MRPIANFIGPVGLYLLSQSLENNGAKAIMKNEFKPPNHEAFTSVISDENHGLTSDDQCPNNHKATT